MKYEWQYSNKSTTSVQQVFTQNKFQKLEPYRLLHICCIAKQPSIFDIEIWKLSSVVLDIMNDDPSKVDVLYYDHV